MAAAPVMVRTKPRVTPPRRSEASVTQRLPMASSMRMMSRV